MSDQGDVQRWRPVSNESGAEPDAPTGPIPAVTGDEPGFPQVNDDEPATWSAETTGGFPASPERAPFEPADPLPAEGQSFSALRASLAERLARYTEPEGGWPDPTPPLDTADPEETPRNGLPTFGEEAQTPTEETGSYELPGDAEEAQAAGGGWAALETGSGAQAPAEETTSYELPGEAAQAAGGGWAAFETDSGAQTPPEETAPYGLPGDAAQAAGGGWAAFETGSGAQAPAEETAPYGLPGDAGETPTEWSAFAKGPAAETPEETVHEPPYGFAGQSVQERPTYVHPDEGQAGDDEFFGSDEHPPIWDKVVAPVGPPPQPGRPSSGNMRLPEWMKDGGTEPPAEQEEGRRSRLPLYAGIGVLVLGLLVAGVVVVLKKGRDTPGGRAASPTAPATGPARAPRDRALARFRGRHTRQDGRIADRRSGLSYPRLRSPWTVAPKTSPMSELGFSVSQFAVTERAATGPKRWGRLMSAELAGPERSAYHGPGTERAAALATADLLEARMYAFRHRKRPLASQPLNVGGHRGWLVGFYLTYHRPGVRTSAEVFTVAVVDTGRAAPGVLCMTVPNTGRRLLPDVNFVLHALRVV